MMDNNSPIILVEFVVTIEQGAYSAVVYTICKMICRRGVASLTSYYVVCVCRYYAAMVNWDPRPPGVYR
jgi:hypothetical protein